MSGSTGALELPGCKRTGMCCQRIPLPTSPRELRESYNNWVAWRSGESNIVGLDMSLPQRNGKYSNYRFHKDIELIYPMLMGRCLGKIDRTIAFHYLDKDPEPEYKHKNTTWDEEDDLDPETEIDTGRLKPVLKRRRIEWLYVYGPCKFFERVTLSPDGKRMLGGCSINDIKPQMCSNFPNGDESHRNEMLNLNRGTFRGCGYNHPGVGRTFEDYANNLVPLDAEEL